MTEYPSYSISSFLGGANSRLQAVQTADRPLCAAVSAVAAYLKTGKIYGTLTDKPESAIDQWVENVCIEHGVLPENFMLWATSIAYHWHGSLDNLRQFPTTIRGLGPSGSDIELDPYQINTVRSLPKAGGVIGAFMGSGKTAMATAAAIAERHEGKRCWIICPLNAMPTWEKAKQHELKHYFDEVKIMSVDSAHKYVGVNSGDVLIIDEAHRLGIQKTRRTKATHIIRSKFRFCLPLTGTMLHAGVAPSLSIKDLAIPGLALFAKTYSAGDHFHCLVSKNIGTRRVTVLERPTGEHKKRFMEWLGLGVTLLTPDSKDVQAAFKLPGQALKEIPFNAPWRKIEEEVAVIANEILAETGELPHAQAVAHVLARAGIESKLEWLGGWITENDVPLVVFANYRESLDETEKLLQSMNITYVRVDGDVTGADRSECERKFQSGEAQVFLGQIHAASESMNLQRASTSIALDVSWSCIDYSQALCRTHRRGQKDPCIHIDLVYNVFQSRVLDRLREGQDFAAECATYQELKRTLTQNQGAIHA